MADGSSAEKKNGCKIVLGCMENVVHVFEYTLLLQVRPMRILGVIWPPQSLQWLLHCQTLAWQYD